VLKIAELLVHPILLAAMHPTAGLPFVADSVMSPMLVAGLPSEADPAMTPKTAGLPSEADSAMNPTLVAGHPSEADSTMGLHHCIAEVKAMRLDLVVYSYTQQSPCMTPLVAARAAAEDIAALG
jgi:hypothetical protein